MLYTGYKAIFRHSFLIIIVLIPESCSRPPPGRFCVGPTIRRVGARRSIAQRAHQAVPLHGGEEDRRPHSPPRGCLRPAICQSANTAALPRACHRGAADSRACLQGNYRL